MSIKGIGTDIIEIDRLKAAIERKGEALLKRLFTQNELDYCYKNKNPYPHLAARFAAKEAVSKALGTGLGKHLSFIDIEIVKDSNKKPLVMLSSSAEKHFKNPVLLISISHSDVYATATAIWDA